MNVASKYLNYILLVCFFGTWVSQSFAKSTTEHFSHHDGRCYQTSPEHIVLLGDELLAEDSEWEDEQDEHCNHFIICNLFYVYLNGILNTNSNPIGIIPSNQLLIEPTPPYIRYGAFRI